MADEPRDIFGDRIRVGDVVAVAVKDEIKVGAVKRFSGRFMDFGEYSSLMPMHQTVILRRYSGVATHQP